MNESVMWLVLAAALGGPVMGALTAYIIQLYRNAKVSAQDGRDNLWLAMLRVVSESAVLAIEERALGTDWRGPVKLEAALLEQERLAKFAHVDMPSTEVRVAALEAALAGLRGGLQGNDPFESMGGVPLETIAEQDAEQARIDLDRIQHPEVPDGA